MARARKQTAGQETFQCPECGRTFTRAAALGAHRRQAHGVQGQSSQARSKRGRARQTTRGAGASARSAPSASIPRNRSRRSRAASPSSDGRRRTDETVDRDALLATLFPRGIPAKEQVIRAVNNWLDEAERLAKAT